MNPYSPSLVDGAADEERARGLLRRHRLARDEALVRHRRPVQHLPVHGNLRAGHDLFRDNKILININ